MRSGSHLVAGVVVLMAAIGSSCGLVELLDEQAVTLPGDPDVEHQVLNLGFGIEAVVPVTWESSEIRDVPSSEIPPGCQTRSGRLSEPQAFFTVEVQLNHEGCDVSQPNRFPRYVSVDNAEDPQQVESFSTPLGPATSFLVTYDNCTIVSEVNAEPVDDPVERCSTMYSRTVLIELDAPTDPEFPTLQLDRLEFDGRSRVEQLRAIAQSLRPA